jgi:hypothetical protein
MFKLYLLIFCPRAEILSRIFQLQMFWSFALQWQTPETFSLHPHTTLPSVHTINYWQKTPDLSLNKSLTMNDKRLFAF